MARSIAEKIGIKEGMRCIFIDAPEEAAAAIAVPAMDIRKRLSGNFDYIHLFAKNQAAFHKRFPALMLHLNRPGMLWVSWPKAGGFDTDLDIREVIRLGYDYGLVESKAISIDAYWSALKFTWPRDHVAYNNSYGKLKAG